MIAFSFRIGTTSVGKIVEVVCTAIWRVLQPIEMPSPTMNTWIASEVGFRKKWDFPNCVAAVKMENPPNCGSLLRNYQNGFSLVLMALVDSSYRYCSRYRHVWIKQ